jgi:hypothetical protein
MTPKPMLRRWRILIESPTSSSRSPVCSSISRSTWSTELLGLLVVAVDEQPAGALGDVAPDQQDAQPEHRPQAEGDPPAQVGREQVLVQQDQ